MTIAEFVDKCQTDETALIITERERGRQYDGTIRSFKREDDDPFSLEIKRKLSNRKIFRICFDIKTGTNTVGGIRLAPTITIVI